MKLLIVDDHAPTRALIREFVQPFATDIFECEDGLEAVDACATLQPDFVIMDIMMPRLNGFAATKQIRRNNSATAVILISQATPRHASESARLAGACGYYSKDDLAGLRQFLASAALKRTAQE